MATILRLIEQEALAEVCWVVLTGGAKRAAEAGASADALLGDAPGKRVILKDFPDGYFPYDGAEIKDFFEELKGEFSPDLIFTHQRADLHQDHRVTCELTWNTFRDHLILEYEIPKYDGDMGDSEPVRSARRNPLPTEDRPPDDALRLTALQALVQGGPVLGPASPARDGVQLADVVCRGVLLSQSDADVMERRRCDARRP